MFQNTNAEASIHQTENIFAEYQSPNIVEQSVYCQVSSSPGYSSLPCIESLASPLQSFETGFSPPAIYQPVPSDHRK